ncbi:MAG: hypothetical protein JRE72_18115 [Deltaproteobacteria bacterium]|jgi:uncharacterized protein YijF (DUF1287 family)|nr:hypothetical protein [Deltaproteobacteria bacterium]
MMFLDLSINELIFEELRTVFSQYFEPWRLAGTDTDLNTSSVPGKHSADNRQLEITGCCVALKPRFIATMIIVKWRANISWHYSSLDTIGHATIKPYLQRYSGASCSSQFIWASKQSQ